MVTDVGGADYSRAVCIQISQAVLVFLKSVSFDGFPQVLGVKTNRPLIPHISLFPLYSTSTQRTPTHHTHYPRPRVAF